jgi:tRNA(adenine34) deaminase
MTVATRDRAMMARCIELAKASSQAGEYPYAAVLCRGDTVVAESINRVTHDRDVTRHAEVVAISQAQKSLDTVSLDDCDIYMIGEPCAFCSYAIRESRIRRVVYGLSSPHMGGVSKWSILTDTDLSTSMPEVFAPPPEIISGFMAAEAERAITDSSPLTAGILKQRGLFVAGAEMAITPAPPPGLRNRALQFLRRNLFDYFGRR